MIRGVESVGLDTIEGEHDIFHKDHHFNTILNHDLSLLTSYSNVIVTPHCSFYTDQVVNDMVELSMKSLQSFLMTGSSNWEIK